ncbi:hypothetical protein DPEC_G00048930 [Dallia pectoralis]|uniref:Uncharacterized protein n=1 Tax=Dallia pectoralis TaxID=75939 RepID=A0ACC2HB80_DALPE|nr:hypothetical protein DPEC_G00048930 [Dallia pectoralis]
MHRHSGIWEYLEIPASLFLPSIFVSFPPSVRLSACLSHSPPIENQLTSTSVAVTTPPLSCILSSALRGARVTRFNATYSHVIKTFPSDPTIRGNLHRGEVMWHHNMKGTPPISSPPLSLLFLISCFV